MTRSPTKTTSNHHLLRVRMPEDADPDNAPTESGDDGGLVGVSRRKLLAAGAGIAVGVGGGIGYSVLTRSKPGTAISPSEPNDDGEASLGELHYLLENQGDASVNLDVTDFRYFSDEDEIEVTYTTRAGSVEDVPPQRQHVREVGHLTRMYAIYVEQDGVEGEAKGKRVHAQINEVVERVEQPDGYYVKREWVEKFNNGEWSANRMINTVLGAAYYEDDGSGNTTEANNSSR